MYINRKQILDALKDIIVKKDISNNVLEKLKLDFDKADSENFDINIIMQVVFDTLDSE